MTDETPYEHLLQQNKIMLDMLLAELELFETLLADAKKKQKKLYNLIFMREHYRVTIIELEARIKFKKREISHWEERNKLMRK